MEISAIQLYGLPPDKESIKKIQQSTGIKKLELNIVSAQDISLFQQLSDDGFSGVHCNLKIRETLNKTDLVLLNKLSNNRLIIPTAVEENSLCWPLSFFRRFPSIYKFLRLLIDQVKFKGLRRIVAGEGVSEKSYFRKAFWLQFANTINELGKADLNIGFHNHGIEFECLEEGETPIDLLDLHLDSGVFFQFDLTNCLMSGHFSMELVRKYLHRIRSYHLRIEGMGNEQFYEDLVQKHPDIFQKRELVIELKENNIESMISRVNWWKNLVSNI